MRRYLMIATIVSVVSVAGSYLAFGQQPQNDPMGAGMMGGGMMGRQGSQRGMMQNNGGMMAMGAMRGVMAQSMMQEGLVATSDGGVVLYVGGKLMKYDSALNLTREVEVKIDYEAMQQRMQKMMESMPMGRMMQGRGGPMGGMSSEQKP